MSGLSQGTQRCRGMFVARSRNCAKQLLTAYSERWSRTEVYPLCNHHPSDAGEKEGRTDRSTVGHSVRLGSSSVHYSQVTLGASDSLCIGNIIIFHWNLSLLKNLFVCISYLKVCVSCFARPPSPNTNATRSECCLVAVFPMPEIIPGYRLGWV